VYCNRYFLWFVLAEVGGQIRAVNEYIRGNFGHIRIRTDISADTRI
jgi:hypothetical protein